MTIEILAMLLVRKIVRIWSGSPRNMYVNDNAIVNVPSLFRLI